MKLLRLSGRKRCDRVLRKGKTWRGKHVMINWMPGPPDHPLISREAKGVFVGVTTSRKLDKSAVKRNRMRRRLRESLRLYVKEHETPTVQLILRPKSTSLICDFAELDRDISAFFSSLRA